MKRLKQMLACLLLLTVAGPLAAAAAEIPPPELLFLAGPTDGNDCFELCLSVSNARFNAFQFALRFDPAVLRPVGPDGSTAAQTFADCTRQEQPWLSTVGCSVDAVAGFLGFTGYLAPGETAPVIADGEVLAGSQALPLFTFRFRRLTKADPGLKIATEALGEPYEPSFPQGAGLMGRAGAANGSVRFDLSALQGSSTTLPLPAPTGSGGDSVPQALTAEALLGQVLLLKLGSPALVAAGGVTAFYPGQRAVVPYADAQNRTLVPLRFLAEQLGAAVSWDNAARSATVKQGGKTIVLTIGSRTYTVDGVAHTMDTVPALSPVGDGSLRTMVPVRFVAEALGQTLAWDGANQLVVIAPAAVCWGKNPTTEAEVLRLASKLLLLYSNFV